MAHAHVLCLKPCERCDQPFLYCHSCAPGRRYCDACAPVAQRERERKAHGTYRHSREGREQHHDEEHERRRRRRQEARAGGRDRRPTAAADGVQTELKDTSAPRADPSPADASWEPVTWLLVATAPLVAVAEYFVGSHVACWSCRRVGPVVRVVEWRSWRDAVERRSWPAV